VQRDDAGHYKLYAKTDSGETAEKDIELVVEDRSFGDNPPAFVRRLTDLAVKVGTRTRLLVEIRSATDVRVTWYRNDRRICENDRVNFVNEGSFYCLEISSITLDDGGKWMCMAENLSGRNSCLATLNVLGEVESCYPKNPYNNSRIHFQFQFQFPKHTKHPISLKSFVPFSPNRERCRSSAR
jgi:hypothetical protein